MKAKRINAYIVLLISLISWQLHAQTGSDLIKSELTKAGVFATPVYEFTNNYDAYRLYPNIKGLLMEGLNYSGKKTKVFCWYGVPVNLIGKAPAVVLVHGGGGDAFPAWVKKWTDRGYVAIAIALEGQIPDKSPTWEFSGPARNGFFGDADKALLNQWFYHAIADVIMANSLLRTFPEVDADNIGITGISWGGIITNVATGIDQRFKFAIPVYGCGFLEYSPTYANVLTGVKRDFYNRYWEPSLYIPLQQQSTLFVNGTNDNHFSMKSFTESYLASTTEKFLRIEHNMTHGHSSGWTPVEIYNFADYVVKGAEKPLKFSSAVFRNFNLKYTYDYSGVVNNAILYYTTDPGNWSGTGYQWLTKSAVLSSGEKTVEVLVPTNAVACFVNIFNSSQGTIYSSPMLMVADSAFSDVLPLVDNSPQKLMIYPNPAIDRLYFSADVSTAKIYSNAGLLVEHYPSTVSSVSVSHLNSGVYLLHAGLNAEESIVNIFIKN